MEIFPFKCIHGGSQTYLGMPRGARTSASINWNIFLFIQVQILPPSIHHKWKKMIDLHSKQPIENHRVPTLVDKVPVPLI